MKPEPMILCPVCRVAVPDSKYYAHAKTHQRGSATSDVVTIVACAMVVTALVLVYTGLCVELAGSVIEALVR